MDLVAEHYPFAEVDVELPPLALLDLRTSLLPSLETPKYDPRHPFQRPFLFAKVDIMLPKLGNRAQDRVEHLLKVLPEGESLKVYVDLGAGDCEITQAIAEELGVEKAYAYDIHESGCTGGLVEYRQIANDKIDLPADSVDLVTAFVSLHHLPFESKYLGEIKRVLRPGGLFFIREHDVRDSRMRKYLLDKHKYYDATRTHMTHVHKFWSRSELRRILERAGFVHVEDSDYLARRRNKQALYHSLYRLAK